MIGYLIALCLLGVGYVCRLSEVRDFWLFVHHHNPLLLRYYDEEEEKSDTPSSSATATTATSTPSAKDAPEAYETKYLAKFRAMPNEYGFSSSVTEAERAKIVASLRQQHQRRKQTELAELDEAIRRADHTLAIVSDPSSAGLLADTDAARQALLRYWGLEDEYDYDPDSIDLAEYFGRLVSERDEWRAKQQTTLAQPDIDVEKEVDQVLLERRLVQLKHNYVTEATPLGNVIMRYNHAKQSFEYFSDRTMPFRMLETVCRKYVTTYFCKPLFVEMETHATSSATSNSATAKPKTDKVANRYSWEGRLREFSPLQSVPRVQKNAMNYAEFKKRFAAAKPTPAAR